MSTNTHSSPLPNPPRLPRGRPRSENKRRTILNAGAALVDERGYHATTMESVASRAGVGKMTIYRWWRSKAALFLEIYIDLAPPDAVVIESADPKSDLRHLLSSSNKILRTTPAGPVLAGLITDALHDIAAHDAVHGGLIAGRRELLTGPFERAIEMGVLGDSFDLEFAAELMVGMIWQRLLTAPDRLDDRFANRLVDTVFALGDH